MQPPAAANSGKTNPSPAPHAAPGPRGAATCREWDLGSGGLKKESGSLRSRMGTVCGTLAVLGFMTALKSASRSVSESPRTCTTWWPAGGAGGAAGVPGGAAGADGGAGPCGAGWGGGCCAGSMAAASFDARGGALRLGGQRRAPA